MDWVTDNIQVIIAIAGAIAYWLNARRKDKAGESADYDGDGEPDNQPRAGGLLREEEDEMEQAEHTRRIQEEIRRKIAERQGGTRTPPPLQPDRAPPPALPSQAWRREQAETRNANEYRRIESEREASAVLERQQALAAQLAALNERRAEASREAKAVWIKPPAATLAGAKHDDHELLSELRNARSLRKAIVLREVLGTPVGLR